MVQPSSCAPATIKRSNLEPGVTAMATASYPKIGPAAWRTLRQRAATAPSTKFSPRTVAPMLHLANPASAATNIVNPMRRLGLIEEDGSLTERGNRWRIDATYAEACQEMLEKVYPPELVR
jgi:hypothetical protein